MSRARDLADSADKDIAGTLTVDGLTVGAADANTTLTGSASASIVLQDTGAATSQQVTQLLNNDGDFVIRSLNDTKTGVVATAMTIENLTGNVGIGTTSPSDKLSLEVGAANEGLSVYYSGTEVGSFRNDAGNLTINANNANLKIETGGTERVRISSAGNVGIGTTSPASPIDVSSASNGNRIILRSTVAPTSTPSMTIGSQYYYTGTTYTGGSQIIFEKDNATAGNYGHHLQFWTRANGSAVAEAMRIDSSGNLLVGTTINDGQSIGAGTQDGTVIAGSSQYIQRGDNANLWLSKPSGATNNDYVKFYSNSSLVGSIGTRAGYLKIGTANTGLLFNSGSSQIYPENPDGGALRDAAIDLGTSISRFKDLYLSGGVYLGGTGAVNHLDDYEEGTWTPVFVSSTNASNNVTNSQSGRYTKIGNFVYAHVNLTGNNLSGITGTDHVKISGLPYTAASVTSGLDHAVNFAGYRYLLTTNHTALVSNGTDTISLTSDGFTAVTYSGLFQYPSSTSTSMKISIAYRVA